MLRVLACRSDKSDPFFDQVTFDQPDGAAVWALDVQIERQTEFVIDGGDDVFAEVLVTDRLAPFVIRGTENTAARNTRTGHDGEAS